MDRRYIQMHICTHLWTMQNESQRMSWGYQHKENLPGNPLGHSWLGAGPKMGLIPLLWTSGSLQQNESASFLLWKREKTLEKCMKSYVLHFSSSGGNKNTCYCESKCMGKMSCKEHKNVCWAFCVFTSQRFKASPNSVITAAFHKPRSCLWLLDSVMFYTDTVICPSENFTALSWISMIYSTCC